MPLNALQVHLAGHFTGLELGTTRREDPPDYLLIWVTRGMTRTICGSAEHQAGIGDLMLLPPHVPHFYAPDKSAAWEWLWVHFGGAAAGFLQALQPDGFAVVHLGLDERIRDRFLELVIASPAGLPGHRPAASANAYVHADTCLASLLGLMIDRLQRLRFSVPRPEDPPFDLPAFQRYVHDHLAEPLTVDELARLAKLSPAHFSRVVKGLLGVPPMQYVIQKRVDRAAMLLTQTPMKLAAIAHAVGYEDVYYFSRLFKKVTGVPPSAYRLQAIGSRE